MKDQLVNYETLLKVSNAISHSIEPEEVALITVEGITTALDLKGCTLFLLNNKTHELEVAASFGLSDEYINKGPLSALHSIAESLKDGPVAITDVLKDPRLQYPEAAKKEGISSILSVPIQVGGKILGAIRVYTSEHRDFTPNDITFVSALAQIAGLSVKHAKYSRGLMHSIDILKSMKESHPQH
jgi:signal transduction protein with GAF and PtsI domain